jgi:pimeloyl-ACP methyl ester carboxylesterase
MPAFSDDQADLLSLLDDLQIERAALVGHSDGGTIALYSAARHPERVSALATLAAHAYVDERMIEGIQGVYRRYQTDAEFRSRLSRRQGKNVRALISGWGAGWLQKENLSWDIRPELGKIDCPALVVQGSEDEHGTPQHAREIAAAIPGADLVLLPGAGHMLLRENTDLVNHLLCAFLMRVLLPEYADVQ